MTRHSHLSAQITARTMLNDPRGGFVSADDESKLAAAKEDCESWTRSTTQALEVCSPP